MSYTPHVWLDQEIIRDNWLNHLERGVAQMGDDIEEIREHEAEIAGDIPTKISELENDAGFLTEATGVSGVKGSEEGTYRKGNVNITKSDIGLTNTENKSSADIRNELTAQNVTDALGYTPAATSDIPSTYVSGVKGNSESSYRAGNVNITKENIGLGNVDNTADSNKSVNYASSAGSASSATKATQDQSGNNIKSSYGASVGISGQTLTLYNKNGASLSTATIPSGGSTKIGTSRSNATDTVFYFIRS